MILDIKINDNEINYLAERVFFKSIDLLGGLKKLAEYRTLTWLPSIARASYAVVLKEEYFKTENDIAEYIGLTKNTVRNMLRADENAAIYKLEHFDELSDEEKKQLKVHTAGGIAKLAYKYVKNGEDSQTVLEYCREITKNALSICEAPWAYMVLKHIKGVKYPITDSKTLEEKLSSIEIKGIKAKEIIKNIQYPIKNPAILLKEIKEYLLMKGI